MVRTAINLWSLRNYDEPLPEIVAECADAGYDGVQFSGGLRGAPVTDLAATLDRVGLEATPAHVGIDDLESAFEATVETYTALGCEGFVVPYLDGSHFADPEAVDATAGRLEAVADRLAGRDLGFHYHNHDAEFTPLESGVAFDRLLDLTDFDIELDVGWVAAAGGDPLDYLDRVAGRAPVIHMRDVDAEGGDAELGEGVVDMEACAAAAREGGAEWFVYERVAPADFPASIQHGAEFLGAL